MTGLEEREHLCTLLLLNRFDWFDWSSLRHRVTQTNKQLYQVIYFLGLGDNYNNKKKLI